MLNVKDLVVTYGKVRAIQGVNIEVRDGEVVSVVGPNGAGKSSLLAAIAGAVTPASGEILYDGKKLNGMGPENVVRHGIALVPEARHIFGQLTVAENLLLGATIRRDQVAVRAHLEELKDMFPVLRRSYGSPAGQLSGGEQQQLAIARALLSEPKLLLLDEPSLGLAPLLVDLVFETIKRLNETGVAILLVEQFVERATMAATRTYVLRGGRVALAIEGGAQDQKSLESAYFGTADTQTS